MIFRQRAVQWADRKFRGRLDNG